MEKVNMLVDGLRKVDLLDKANRQIQNGSVSQFLKQQFGRQVGSVLFELIGIGQQHEDDLDIEYVEEE